jgi:hypothetical protein
MTEQRALGYPLSRLLVLTALVVAAVGCGGSDDDSAVTSSAPALTADKLAAALLTPEEVGQGWRGQGAQPLEIDADEDMGGRCPDGTDFASPTVAMVSDYDPPDEFADNTISEGVLTFQQRSDLEAWIAALESCVGEQWEESGDPVEYVTLETMAVADHGDDRAGFLFHFAHGQDEGPAHDSRWSLVRVGDALVIVTGEDYELENSDDEELLADVLGRAVEKAQATLQS